MSDQEPSTSTHQTAGTRHNARWGMILFIVYMVFYAGFVALATYSPTTIMARPFLAGVNVAIIYGFGLIIGAFLVALVYLKLSRPTSSTDGK